MIEKRVYIDKEGDYCFRYYRKNSTIELLHENEIIHVLQYDDIRIIQEFFLDVIEYIDRCVDLDE